MALLSAAEFLALVAVNRPTSFLEIALLAALSVFSSYLLNLLLEYNKKSHLQKLLREDLVSSLYRVCYRKSKGGSFLKAVNDVANEETSQSLKAILSQSAKKLAMGADFLSAIGSNPAFVDHSLLKNLEGSSAEEIKVKLLEHSFNSAKAHSEMDEALNRNATVNMFLSVVLPSFLLFAFVGSSIVSEVEASMLLLSITIVIFVPAFYALGNRLLYRRLFV